MCDSVDTESHEGNSSRATNSNALGEHLLPIANVAKIMKQALPPSAKISKEAKETVQECVSEFIGFVTGEASERCQREKRKTVNGDDIVCAFKTLGLDHYADAMRRYLHMYREHVERSAVAKNDKSIKIDIRHELSIVRRDRS